jgi:hypothetical protein
MVSLPVWASASKVRKTHGRLEQAIHSSDLF